MTNRVLRSFRRTLSSCLRSVLKATGALDAGCSSAIERAALAALGMCAVRRGARPAAIAGTGAAACDGDCDEDATDAAAASPANACGATLAVRNSTQLMSRERESCSRTASKRRASNTRV